MIVVTATVRRILFLPVVFFFFVAKAQSDSLAEQVVVYKTKNASEVTLVWGINDWKLPGPAFYPSGSYLRDGILYSPMIASGDSFYVTLKLPENTYLNYIFWFSKDKKGKTSDYWDKNNDHNYNTFVNKNVGPVVHTDTYSHYQYAFNIFSWSWNLFIPAILALILLYLFYRSKGRSIPLPGKSFHLNGVTLSLIAILFLSRLHMNVDIQDAPWLLAGAAFQDLLFVLLFTATGLLLIQLTKNKAVGKLLFSVFYFFLLLFALIALLNIDVVKYLGTPLNYQWLYYSGFLKSADAKNALQNNMTPAILINILLLLSFVVVTGILFAFLLKKIARSRILTAGMLLFPAVLLAAGYTQLHSHPYDKKKISNPTIVFVRSFLQSGTQDKLFTLPVEASVRANLSGPARDISARFVHSQAINNIVIFVLESTPAEYLQTYGSKYRVTPNLERWSREARIFTNCYAPVPATPNSLFTIVSGMYPAISYKLTCNERPDFPAPSIASILEENWQKGAFQAADMNFNDMGLYLKYQDFDTVVDFRNLNCGHNNFKSDWEYLDGVEDSCMVQGALQWLERTQNNKLLLCWTMQTHYPYFVSGLEDKFETQHPDFNRYLNALHNSDAAFGMLMEGLERRQILNQTLVIVVGDHGEAFGRHDQTTHGSKIYEENIHIPCLLINPQLFHGEQDDRIGGLVDLAPTIADVLGIELPSEWQGHSLLSPHPYNRTFFFCPYADFLFGTRSQNMKLIYNASQSRFELYDIEKDPHEANNLAEKFPEMVNHEYQYLAAWAQEQQRIMQKYLPSEEETQ